MVPAGYTEEEVERAICEALDAAEIEDMATSEIAALCALATLPTREAMRAEIERLTKIIDNHNADAAARGGDRIRFPLAAVEAEAEIERLTGVIGHIQEHLTRDEDFDADELLRDIRDSVDLSEFDRLVLRAEAAERKLAEADEAIAYYGSEEATDQHFRWGREAYGRWRTRGGYNSAAPPSPEEKGG